MGYTTGATAIGGTSDITSLYPNFFSDSTYSKYWDKYTSTVNTNYNNRILGDATGEIGPFGREKDPDNNYRNKSSWYKNLSVFIDSSYPWLARSGLWYDGTVSGIFAFNWGNGNGYMYHSYRVVLTP